MKFIDALLRKRTCTVALAEAEQSCHEWEYMLRHFVGDSAVQYAIQANPTNVEGDTIKGRYTEAVARIRWRQFYVPRQGHLGVDCAIVRLFNIMSN